MDIKELVSERSIETNRYDSIILEPTQQILNDLHRSIEVFPHLVALDYAPKKFMQLLADIFGFTYLETEDDEVQREILKRLINEYHKKGLVSELYKISNRAFDKNFYLGDLTYYNNKIDEGYSTISYPRDRLFRYDYSRWDGGHRWPDLGEWREGVVDIDLSKPSDRTYEYIDKYLAAGLKFYVSTLRDFGDEAVDMVYKLLDHYDQWLIQDLGWLDAYFHDTRMFRWDYSKWDEDKRESRYVISSEIYEEKKCQAAIHRIFFPEDFGYTVAEVYREPFIWNWNRFIGVIGGYVEPDCTDIDLKLVTYDFNADDESEVSVDSVITRPFATASNEAIHDSKPWDSMAYDAHQLAQVEIYEESKRKVQFGYDSIKMIDEVAWDGDVPL